METAATLTRETKPFKKVFSCQSGEDLLNRLDFDRRQINEKQITEGRTTEDKSSRSKERPTQIREYQIKGNKMTRTSEAGPLRDAFQRVRTHCKKRLY
jgi:hypothetical protein